MASAEGHEGPLSPFAPSDEDSDEGPDLEVRWSSGERRAFFFWGAAAAAAAAACLLPACSRPAATALPLAPPPSHPPPVGEQVFSDDEDLVRDTSEAQLAAGRDPQGIPWELTQFTREGYRVRLCLGSGCFLGGVLYILYSCCRLSARAGWRRHSRAFGSAAGRGRQGA